MQELDLLVVVAHPDDEVYGVGGTLAEYAALGKITGLITLTRGRSGRTLGLCEPSGLADLRELELRASVETLGISAFRQYEYEDAASPSREGNVPVSAFQGGLKAVPQEELVNRLAKDLRDLRPRILITFPPDGVNGHPDHCASNEVVLEALKRADLLLQTSVYYFATTAPYREDWRDRWLPPTHTRDVSPYLATKLRAIACHRTQALSTVEFLRRAAERIVVETFHRAHPVWTDEGMGRDLS